MVLTDPSKDPVGWVLCTPPFRSLVDTNFIERYPLQWFYMLIHMCPGTLLEGITPLDF